VARRLASTDRARRFDGVDVRVDPQGAVIVQNAPAWMTVRVYEEMPAGDHDVVLLEVLSIDSLPGAEAMVFHRSRFKELVREDLPA
jgi:flavin reductase (DIM6/NTAB) family NADH-FMN oxidoreductase RutF